MWDDQAADIDDDIQGNSTSDLPPSNVMPMAEDLVEESVSRKANAVTMFSNHSAEMVLSVQYWN